MNVRIIWRVLMLVCYRYRLILRAEISVSYRKYKYGIGTALVHIMWGFIVIICPMRRNSSLVVLNQMYRILEKFSSQLSHAKRHISQLSISFFILCFSFCYLCFVVYFCHLVERHRKLHVYLWVFWTRAEGLCVTSSWNWLTKVTHLLFVETLYSASISHTRKGQTRSELSTQAEVLRNRSCKKTKQTASTLQLTERDVGLTARGIFL